jgi:hypothetical protein
MVIVLAIDTNTVCADKTRLLVEKKLIFPERVKAEKRRFVHQ